MNNGFSSVLGVEGKGALPGMGHSREKSLTPQSSVRMRGAWGQGLCVHLLMLYKHEIGKIVKAVKEITEIEDDGKQLLNLFLWQVKWTSQGHVEVPGALCSCLTLSYFLSPSVMV